MEPITMFYIGSAISNLVNSKLSREATAELEDKRLEFQKSLENQRYKFQREQFEQQKELQLELAERNRKAQLELAEKQRETQLELLGRQRETQVELEELREVSQNWPLRTIRPASILKAHQDEAIIPLCLIPAPPVVDYDSFGAANKGFPNIEEGLSQGLREFLSKYYPQNSTERPVELLDGAWDSKRYHGGSVIKLLHGWLKSKPILILESVIDSNSLHFRFAYWGAGQKKYSYQSILADLPYREIVYESVKARAQKWKETRDKLAKLDKSPDEIKRLGGDNAANLEILEQEEEYRQLGIDFQQLDLQKRYKISEQDFRYLCQFLTNCHSLVAGFIVDIHYLIQNNAPPLLPKLLPELTEDFSNPHLLESIVKGYQQVYQALSNERPVWMPELALDLANSLKYLPDKTWAKEQVKASIQSWLRVRGVTPPERITEAICAMKSVMSLEDEEYFTALQQCLMEIEESLATNQIKRLFDEYTFEFETLTLNRKGEKTKEETKQAQFFIEDLGNGITLKMVAVPGGKFIMGSPEGQGTNDERPQHEVTVPSFFMGKFPVTQEQWKAVAYLPKVERDLDPNLSYFKGEDRPMETVSWNDAVEFCKRLSQKTGKEYRLPSEAEWEYVCRAGTTTPFYFGETITGKLANYCSQSTYAEESPEANRGETSSVGQFPPNAFGLYDIHGNVWEWCADIWHDNYVGAPTDGSAWTEGGNKDRSPLRGGSWLYPADSCRSAFRIFNTFGHDDTNDNIGFRVACSDKRTMDTLRKSITG